MDVFTRKHLLQYSNLDLIPYSLIQVCIKDTQFSIQMLRNGQIVVMFRVFQLILQCADAIKTKFVSANRKPGCTAV